MRIKAFTLIEMTVVLAILGVIASTVVVNQLERVKVRAVQLTAAEISELQQAAMLYYVNNNAWPANCSNLTSAGYISANWNCMSKLGANYAFSNTSNLFTVNTTLPAGYAGYDYIFNNSLPMGGSSAGVVSSTIPLPGSATAIRAAVPQGQVVLWNPDNCKSGHGNTTCNKDTSSGGDNCPVGFSVVRGLEDKFLVSNNATWNPSAGGSLDHRHTGIGYVVPEHMHPALDTVPPVELKHLYAKITSRSRAPEHYYVNGFVISNLANVSDLGYDVADVDIDGSTGLSSRVGLEGFSGNVTNDSGVVTDDARPPFATVLLCEKN